MVVWHTPWSLCLFKIWRYLTGSSKTSARCCNLQDLRQIRWDLHWSGEFLGLPLSLLLSTKTTATKQESNSPNPTPLSINGEFDFLPQTRLELTYGHPRRDWCKVWAQLKGRRKEYSRKKKLKGEIEAKNCSLHFITNNKVYNYSITIKSNWIK